ncbi:MAG: hypothetical protein NTX79_05610 [Candidatus Micrarchaeota archaeon]|nr:hypothetical protein [Candidatus Micrarchaeota archaeon]
MGDQQKQLFTVYGGGYTKDQMGGKGFAIYTRQDALLQVSLSLVERHILSVDFINYFLKRCGATDAWARGANYEEVARLIDRGKFSKGELKILEGICKLLSREPALAIRSSAHGDSKGTGAYDSFFAMNTPEAVEHFVKEVLKSHFATDAVNFRKSLGFPDGMAVMVEPFVAEKVGTYEGFSGFAPRLSGNLSMSSYLGKNIPQINAFEGLANLKEMDAGLMVEIDDRYDTVHDLVFDKGRVEARMVRELIKKGEDCALDNMAAISFLGHARVVRADGSIAEVTPKWDFDVDFYHMDLTFDWVFNALLEYSRLGYHNEKMEWSMRAEKGKPVFYINQCSSGSGVEIFHFDLAGKRLGTGVLTQVDGKVESPLLVRITGLGGWFNIRKINQANKSYILLLDYDMFKSKWLAELLLKMDDISNAKGVVFVPPESAGEKYDASAKFLDTMLGHRQGIFAGYGKIMAELQKFDWGAIAHLKKDFEGYCTYQVDTRLLSSERDSRVHLYMAE